MKQLLCDLQFDDNDVEDHTSVHSHSACNWTSRINHDIVWLQACLKAQACSRSGVTEGFSSVCIWIR